MHRLPCVSVASHGWVALFDCEHGWVAVCVSVASHGWVALFDCEHGGVAVCVSVASTEKQRQERAQEQ